MKMKAGSRILITGGSGFVGTNLVGYFQDEGHEVLNFDILSPRNSRHVPVWRSVDIRDRENLISQVAEFKPEYVLHCAARTDLNERCNLDGYNVNFDGVCHLIEAIRMSESVQRAVFFSSQLVCRLGYRPKTFEDYDPSTLYGRSKVLGEKIIKTARDFGSIWTIVRPTSLWGPWFDIPYKSFFLMIKRGLYFHPRGTKILKQWGFVGNTVHQIVSLLKAREQDVHRKTFYLADYEPIELGAFADQVQAIMGAPPIRRVSPGVLAVAAGLGDALRVLGWKTPPLTRFRLSNILTDEVQDLGLLQRVAGCLTFETDQALEITANWMDAD